MYHFDETYTAKITLNKLTQAAKRGVNVVLMHDMLVSSLDPELEQEFVKAGGNYARLGELHKIWQMFNREYFKRSHEKLVYADNKICLGSANISADYAHKKYGVSFFYDLNMYAENVCLDDARDFLIRNANYHGVV